MPQATTDRSTQVLRAVIEFHEEFGFAPTRRELAKRVGLSHVSITRWILKLRSRGALTCVPGRMRTVRPTGNN